MASKALIGGMAAAGVVILGVGGVALATGDRESSVDTLTLTTSAQGDSGTADAPTTVPVPQTDPQADTQGDSAGTSNVDGDAGSSDAAESAGSSDAGSGSADAVPAGVTAEQAREIAVQAKPGTVDWMELTSDYGTTVWYVEVVTPDRVEWDVYVDARSGEVVNVERD